MKINLKNAVIARTPRKNPVLCLGFFWSLSIGIIAFLYYLILPGLFLFDGINTSVRFGNLEFKQFGSLFIVYITIAFTIAAIRNNTKSQPVEALIVLFSFIWFLFFAIFSAPLTYFWADIHGYHYDHFERYESGRHGGGWYIFKLNRNWTDLKFNSRIAVITPFPDSAPVEEPARKNGAGR